MALAVVLVPLRSARDCPSATSQTATPSHQRRICGSDTVRRRRFAHGDLDGRSWRELIGTFITLQPRQAKCRRFVHALRSHIDGMADT